MTHGPYSRLMGERNSNDEFYRLYGLRPGEDFRDDDSYDTIEASYLFVEGVGFASSEFEFSQHGMRVVVKQNTPQGSANITFETE